MAKAPKGSLAPSVAEEDSPQTCHRCELWKYASQAVEGEGAAHASIMLVGEQPGDEEDVHGHPFVGPASRVLDTALATAGLARKQVFITKLSSLRHPACRRRKGRSVANAFGK